MSVHEKRAGMDFILMLLCIGCLDSQGKLVYVFIGLTGMMAFRMYRNYARSQH